MPETERAGSGSLAIGARAVDAGRFAEAARLLRFAAEADPSSFEAHTQLGRAHLGVGDARAAEESFRRALALSPESVPAACGLAQALFEQGRPIDARVILQSLLGQDPECGEARALLEGFARRESDAAGRIELDTSPEVLEAVRRKPERVERDAWLSLLAGSAAGALFCAVPSLNFILQYLAILIHEAGHAIAGWLLGFPSLPALNFMHGGGVTLHFNESPSYWIVGLVYLALGGLVYLLREERHKMAVAAGCLVLYAVVAHTRLSQLAILFMGHGAELAVAGIFLYKAISGGLVSAGERPIYAFCGAYLLFHSLVFGWQLQFDPSFRADYYNPASGIENDFVLIAGILRMPLAAAGRAFFALSFLPLPAALLVYRYRRYW